MSLRALAAVCMRAVLVAGCHICCHIFDEVSSQFQISKLNGIEKSDALVEIVRHDTHLCFVFVRPTWEIGY